MLGMRMMGMVNGHADEGGDGHADVYKILRAMKR